MGLKAAAAPVVLAGRLPLAVGPRERLLPAPSRLVALPCSLAWMAEDACRWGSRGTRST